MRLDGGQRAKVRAARRMMVVTICATFPAFAALSSPPASAQESVGARAPGFYSPSGAHLPFPGTPRAVCGQPGVGLAQCLTDLLHPSGVSPRAGAPTGLSPSTVDAVYGFAAIPTAGFGQTIALVDAYNDPNAASDLQQFSSQYGLLSECTGGSSPPSCFEFSQVNENGGNSLPTTDSGWGLEISLDIEWAHALAPGANILLVEASSNNLSDLLTAEQYAALHANYVSNSWGSSEFSGENFYDSYLSQPGVSYFAAAGDSPGAVLWPSASPEVISVGGTSLTFSSGDTLSQESAWSSGGGGCSGYEVASEYQLTGAVDCAGKRATPDMSLDADPNSGVAVYDSSYDGQSGWWTVGGTSASTPMVAAHAAATGTVLNAKALYANPPDISLRDIVTGNNSHPATIGYDLATGLGSFSETPGAPTGLSARSSASGVLLDWNAPSGAVVASYTIWRGSTSGAESTKVAALPAATTSYTDTAVSSGATAYYEVQAANNLGVGPLSNEASNQDEASSYTVSFNANGGTGTMSSETDSLPAPLTANAFSRAGYVFSSWNTAPDGTGTLYADGATYPFTTSATLYAEWTVNTVNPPASPGVSGLSPSSGPARGGTSVAITGTGFSVSPGHTTVHFGSGQASAVACPSTTRCTVTAPAGTGAVDVTVTVPGGTSPTSSADIYSYVSVPTVSSLSPGSGPRKGGTKVTVLGTNFAGTVLVRFGAKLATSVRVLSSSELTVVSPSGSGIVHVTVGDAGGTSKTTLIDRFTYAPTPMISKITRARGATRATIWGRHFFGPVKVYFGAQKASGVRMVSASEIFALLPRRSGTFYVTVETAGGSSNRNTASLFKIVAPPTVLRIIPSRPPKEGHEVTIWGKNFVGAVRVYFGTEKAADVVVLSSSKVVALAPSGSGPVYVVVSAAGGFSKRTALSRYTN